MTLVKLGHSRLSPSAAHRWIPCPGSLQYPDGPDSEAAMRGTHSHAVLELVLTGNAPKPGTWLESKAGRRIVEERHVYQALHIQEFLHSTYPRAKGFEHTAEERVEIGTVLWPEIMQPLELAGTLDISARSETHLAILDAKFGFKQISPVDNPQLILYAIPKLSPEIVTVDLVIAQPDFSGEMQFRVHSTTRLEILTWIEQQGPAILAAHGGDTRLQPGEHCGFCSGKVSCGPYLRDYQEMMSAAWKEGLSFEELLPQVERVREICDALEKAAFDVLAAGGELPGYKLVETVPHRQFADDETDVVRQVLAADPTLEPLDCYNVKLKSPSQMEKLIGKKKAATLATMRPPGKPRLARADDPAPALGPIWSAKDAELAQLGLDYAVDTAVEEE